MATEFKEIGRVSLSDKRDIIVSQVLESSELKGININSYISTPKYTGFTKGTFIPKENIQDFKAMIAKIL